jgi:gamma-glutamyltranspeptidase/glutathione hydrolase
MKKFASLLLLVLAVPLAAGPVSNEPVRGHHAMVASVSEIASQIGADIMKKGGTAADAAVAVQFALQVVWPEAGNIGGGGFLVLRTADGKTDAIDYRERAPLAATRDMYLDASGNIIPGRSTVGHLSVGVPGTVAGMVLVHKKYGKLKWADLVEPARKLAADGFVVSDFLARRMVGDPAIVAKLARFPESARIYLPGGKPLQAGATLVQPELAKTLARIARDPNDFYTGATAKMLVTEVQSHGGILTMKDLAEYAPAVRKPLVGKYRDYQIITMPPPSSGGVTLIEILNMLDVYNVNHQGYRTLREQHLLLEVMRRAYADRAKWLGDPDFGTKIPFNGLTNKRYGVGRITNFDPILASPSENTHAGNPVPYESPQTTHFTIMDPDGTVISTTTTLNDSFGSGVTVKGAGFLLNDEMDDFTSKAGAPNLYGLIQGEANAIAPKHRPLSSMTPVIVTNNNKFVFALGSPGGPQIITSVLQVMLNIIDFGMSIQQAINEPRIHHQWMPDEVFVEPGALSNEVRDGLTKMGYVFHAKEEEEGDVQGIMIDWRNQDRLGGSDWRRGGKAAGF